MYFFYLYKKISSCQILFQRKKLSFAFFATHKQKKNSSSEPRRQRSIIAKTNIVSLCQFVVVLNNLAQIYDP